MKLIKKLMNFILFIAVVIIMPITILYITVHYLLIEKNTKGLSEHKHVTDKVTLNIELIVDTFKILGILIFFFIVLMLLYKLCIKIFEKRNYRYFIVAAYPSDYGQDENLFYDKHVNLLHRMHTAITRPYYSKIIFGKMKFGMYIMCDEEGNISIYYAVHKNRVSVFETFFKQQFPSSDLFEKEMKFKNYKHYRKLFSHNPKTFFDDKKEMTRELYTNIQSNSCLMLEVQAEHKNILRQQIKNYSKAKAKENGVKNKVEIDGIYQNEKKELKNRITDKEVIFNVNIIAATDEKWKFAFAHDVQSATKAHNEIKVYRWPLYIHMIQKIPNVFYSKTYMTDKELAVIFRFPCEEVGE